MNKTTLNTTLAAVLGFAAIGAQAAVLNNGDQLTLNTGIYAYDGNGNQIGVASGSYFAMDTDGNSKIAGAEKSSLSMGTTGIIIGQATSPGASHSGWFTSGDTNAIDAPWAFLANVGSDYTTVGITGSTSAGLDFSGWTTTWNGIPAINMGGGAWGTGYSNGVANFAWSGVYGSAYTLDYSATVPVGDPSGFGGVRYFLHLEGVVASIVPEVPVPAAVWLFGSGLVGLLGVVRRKSST